jgi:hypothetical protein
VLPDQHLHPNVLHNKLLLDLSDGHRGTEEAHICHRVLKLQHLIAWPRFAALTASASC